MPATATDSITGRPFCACPSRAAFSLVVVDKHDLIAASQALVGFGDLALNGQQLEQALAVLSVGMPVVERRTPESTGQDDGDILARGSST